MAGKGGYQAPRNPAPVSGPGKLSKRTDGGPAQALMTPTGLPYGEAGALDAAQRGAPLSQMDSVPTAAVGGPGAGPEVVGMGEPSRRPGEPVTAGSPLGPGPGPEVLGRAPQQGQLSQMLSQLSASDISGEVAALYEQALMRGL